LDAWIAPSLDEISVAADAVIDGTWRPLMNSRVQTIDWVDGAWSPRNSYHEKLLEFWQTGVQQHPKGRITVDTIDPLRFRNILSYVMLLDVEADGFDARYRVYGTSVAEFAGKDWTGYSVSGMCEEAKTDVALFLRATYLAVWRSKRLLFTHYRPPPWSMLGSLDCAGF